MKLSELMQGYNPTPEYAGVATNDDFVLAVDIEEGGAKSVDDYTVVQGYITGVDAQLSAETDEKTYIRAGKATTKTATQRTFSLSGDRAHGDDFQDFATSHAIKFGTGQSVIRPYVYFSLLTGLGEKGTASIIVNSDASGDAGSTAEIDIDIMATKAPEEFDYAKKDQAQEVLSASTGRKVATVEDKV